MSHPTKSRRRSCINRVARWSAAALWLASLSCIAPSAPWGPQPAVLSETHVTDLKLKESELERIQVYLGTNLKIKGKRVVKEGSVSRAHGLIIEKTHREERVEFGPNLPGRIIDVYHDWEKWKDWHTWKNPENWKDLHGWQKIFNNRANLKVSFERDERRLVLEFEPDADGNYRLVLNSGKVSYGGRGYECLEGCADNYLLVPARVIKKWKHAHKTAHGWSF